MTKERALLLSVVVLGCFVAAHSIAAEQKIQASTEEPAEPWTALVANDAPEDFSFVVVADRTGGRYFHAADAGALGEVIEEIDRLERSEISEVRYLTYEYHYASWVGLGGMLIAGAALLSGTALRRLP